MNENNRKKVLVVGAGGFTGGFICGELLDRGYEIWAGVRATTSRKYLADPRLKFVVFDFDNPESLVASLDGALAPDEKWDYIVYNLGATKCLHFMDFNRINYLYLRDFTRALHQADKVPEKFLYMSSLSVMGPGAKDSYLPFDEKMVPMPNTRYGASKLKAEMWLQTAGIPFIVFRATGIYGPRDHDYFLMFDSIGKGFDFSVGYKRQLLTFIYVEDLARAVCDALERGKKGETYIVGEKRAYSQKEFRQLVCSAMNRRGAIAIRMPLWAVKAVSAVCEKIGVARGKPSTLNSDKFRIMAQRNWLIDTSKAERDFGFKIETPLASGIEKSIEWYREAGWLKK